MSRTFLPSRSERPRRGGGWYMGQLPAVGNGSSDGRVGGDCAPRFGRRFEDCPSMTPSGVRASQTYRMRAALSTSDTESTTVVFLELFPPVAYPEVMLMLLSASFIANFPSAPVLFGSSTWSTSASVYLSRASASAFFALLTLSTRRCVVPSVPDVVVRQLRILIFWSPSAFAISASIPGRFSWETLNCLAFGMAGTPRKECAE